jgi:iron complex transport system permease protein
MIRARNLFIMLGVLLVVCTFVSLSTGSVTLSWSDVWSGLSGNDDGLSGKIVRELRLGRAICAFVVGGLLALAGVLMQVLLRNPLADPYVLGVSGGAAVLALTAMSLGLGAVWVHGGALCGALLSMLLVFGLARGRGQWTPTRLLLTGIVVAAGWGALISLLLALSPDRQLRGMLFWLMGDIGYETVSLPVWLLLGAGLALATALARSLNLLIRGEDQAAVLGVDVNGLRLVLYLLASLMAGLAVMLAGSIGFVGLIVPHLLRLLIGGDHRVLLPAAVLLGGCLLMLADVLARTLVAPQQLPVGVVTALIGVPVFLLLLYRNASLATLGR